MAKTSKKTTYKNKLNKIIDDHGMKQKIKDYTRITQETKTLIDLVITNDKSIEGIVINSDQITDHSTLNIINNKNKEEENMYEEKTILSKYNTKTFQEILQKQDWSFEKDINKNCSEKAKQMVNILKNSIESFKKKNKNKKQL